jgi:hypothetical protein
MTGPGLRCPRDERGAALLLALLLMTLLAAIGAGLATLSVTETLIGASHRQSVEAALGAEAALERALHDLSAIADWSAVLAEPPANVMSTFCDGLAYPVGPDGRPIDLQALTAERQRAGADDYAGAVQWRLFAHGPLRDLLPPPRIDVPVYLVVWVARGVDRGPTGGEPDPGGGPTLLVHAEGIGSGGTRRAMRAAVDRAPGGPLAVVSRQRVR